MPHSSRFLNRLQVTYLISDGTFPILDLFRSRCVHFYQAAELPHDLTEAILTNAPPQCHSLI